MRWYICKKNEISGPFTTEQVQQCLLLGRATLEDQVSQDKEDWRPVYSLPELIPEIMKMDPNDEQSRERLAAARRWADERRGERRSDAVPGRAGAGRRQQTPSDQLEALHHREVVDQNLEQGNDRSHIGLIVAIILLSAGAWAGVRWVPQQTSDDNMMDSKLDGTELSYTASEQGQTRRCQFAKSRSSGCQGQGCKPEECDLD